jgi:hypothetical protein
VNVADPHILSTLRRKRDDIHAIIKSYEAKIEAAKHDLSAVNSTLRLFELSGETLQFPAYVDLGRLWKRGEIAATCREALAKEGPLDTRELAVRVLRAKGLDESDKVMRQTVAFRVVQALSIAAKRGTIGGAEKRKGVRIWTERPCAKQPMG